MSISKLILTVISAVFFAYLIYSGISMFGEIDQRIAESISTLTVDERIQLIESFFNSKINI